MLRFVFVATAFLFSVSAQADRWVAFDNEIHVIAINLDNVSAIDVYCSRPNMTIEIGNKTFRFEDEDACEDAWDDIMDLFNEEYGYVKVEVD
jgi:hypothetical protein